MRKTFAGNGNPPPKDPPIKQPLRQAPTEPVEPAEDGQPVEETSDKK